MEFVLNSSPVRTEIPPGTVVLDYLRSQSGLRGTKEGCREGDCGACTVLVGELTDEGITYSTRVSCLLLLGHLEGRHLVTIEGLMPHNLTGIQQAMVDVGATQCGFCTPGIVMALTGFALGFEQGLTFEDALGSLDGNICRCTGYKSIARAARIIHERLQKQAATGIGGLIKSGIVPEYFGRIPEILSEMEIKDGTIVQGDRDIIVAGGTDIALGDTGTLGASKLRFLTGESRGNITEDQDGLRIDATVSFEKFAKSPSVREYIPQIEKTMTRIASTPIRNAATLGGNIVNGSPSGDLSVLLLSLDAVVGIGNAAVERPARLRDFFTGYKQNILSSGEWIKWVRIPRKMRNCLKNFEKVSKRTHLDIATVNTGCSIRLVGEQIEEVLLSAGGVAPVPLFLKGTCDFLKGKQVSGENTKRAVALAVEEIAPIDDIRGSSSYKTLLLGQLIFAHFYEMLGLFPVEQDNAR